MEMSSRQSEGTTDEKRWFSRLTSRHHVVASELVARPGSRWTVSKDRAGNRQAAEECKARAGLRRWSVWLAVMMSSTDSPMLALKLACGCPARLRRGGARFLQYLKLRSSCATFPSSSLPYNRTPHYHIYSLLYPCTSIAYSPLDPSQY